MADTIREASSVPEGNDASPLPLVVGAAETAGAHVARGLGGGCPRLWRHRHVATRGRRLSYLAPDITQAILDGRQPPDLTAEKLLEHSRLPLAWHDQRIVLGFA